MMTSLEEFKAHRQNIGGTIPSSLLSLDSLQILRLDNNLFSGTISSISSSLKDLHLEQNYLTGTVPSLATLTKLTVLHLDNNMLTGLLPDVSTLSLKEYEIASGNSFNCPIENYCFDAEKCDWSEDMVCVDNSQKRGTIYTMG